MMIWQKYIFVLFLPLLVLGCTQASQSPETVPDETEVEMETAVPESNESTPPLDPTEETTQAEIEVEEADEASAVETVTETAVPVAPIDDQEAIELMYALSQGDSLEASIALERIQAANDERFIGVLLELFRSTQIGITRSLELPQIVPVLAQLSGQSFANHWEGWVEWYGGTDLTVPNGFTGWKGQILSEIDLRFGDFLQDDKPANIRVEEIMWGGVLVDGIPPLDNPTMITPAEALYLNPWDPVFGLSINGDNRAYPLRIIDWHEMANDVVGGVPVSIAYCTLCGAAIAYDGRGSDGTTYDFSSSGFLFRSNKLMYDRQTETLWNQLTGEPVLGDLVDSDVKLELLPIVLTTWEAWQAQHPDTVVVDVNTGFDRPYDLGSAYGDYFSSSVTMFPVWQRSQERETKDFVFALNIQDTPKAYPVDLLTEAVVINDAVADTAVVLVATRGVIETEGRSRRVGSVTYTSGAEVRAYERGSETFTPGPDENSVLDSQGRQWQITEEALLGPDGETAPRISGHLAYWFGWFAFYPETLLYEE